MKNKLTHYIRAGYSGIYILSAEEIRVEAELKAIAEELQHGLVAWSVTQGMLDTNDGKLSGEGDPLECMDQISELPEKTIVLLRDYHLFLEDSNPAIIRALKDQIQAGRNHGRILILVGCRLALPAELEREFVVMDFSLPSRQDLQVIAENIATSAELECPKKEALENLLDAASGLTSIEAENAFALSAVESSTLSPSIVAREKANEIKKNGMLEVCDSPENLLDIGGLDLLKEWLMQRRNAFGRDAQDYRLPSPKGVLIIGIPGTGKSLTAKATASVFERPLLKLDIGRLFGGLVGQSEANLRSVIATVEAIAPCVLWIDEIEKGFSGVKGSGMSDGGTSSRVFGSFLSWMQDRTSPVFVVATANDVSQMPPEFVRKGRFDELFFIDLPNLTEREAIWRLQIRKYARQPESFEIDRLAAASEGFTGAEIEQTFREALYAGFSREEEPNDLLVAQAIGEQTPLSQLMGEPVQALRKWAKGRARPATKPAKGSKSRKIVVTNN